MRLPRLLAALIFVFAFCIAGCDQATSNGVRYKDANDLTQLTVEEVLNDFLYMAFKQDMEVHPLYLPVDARSPDAFIKHHYSSEKAPDYEFVIRPNGLPDDSGLLKWVGPVSIAMPTKYSKINRSTVFKDTHLNSAVQQITPLISSLTGLSITPSNTHHGSTVQVSIVMDYPFKPLPVPPGIIDGRSYAAGERTDWKGGIPFTPYLDNQVHGHAFLSADRAIARSKCMIWGGHTKEMKKTLLAECIIRSLGFVNASKITRNALVSNWNDRWHYDPSDQFRSYDPPVTGLTKYDQLLVSIMYDKRIKQGMTKPQLRKALPPIIAEKMNHLERKD